MNESCVEQKVISLLAFSSFRFDKLGWTQILFMCESDISKTKTCLWKGLWSEMD